MEPTMISDAVLKQDVEEELAWHPDIDSDHIGIRADNGVVTLKGYVPTYAQKHAAEAAVKRVAGVRGVVESLQVFLAGSNPTEDEELAKRAINSLDWDALVPSQSVKVAVEGGWVSLAGEVSWQYQKNAAENAVRKLCGVVVVINNITVKPQPQPADLKQRIEKALQRVAELHGKSVRVAVANGTVTLEGTVDSCAARDHAEGAVWAAPGVIEVCDNLRVVPHASNVRGSGAATVPRHFT
jgi:osmotically-inducible protein OsmY